jgi:immunity protein, SdpI family
MKNKLNWLEGVLLLAPIIALVVLWRKLPERVPMHWNLRGEIDSWGSKPLLFFMPITGLVIIGLLRFLPRIDPKLRRSDGGLGRMQNAVQMLRLALAAFFGAIFYIQCAVALGHDLPVSRFIPAALLLLLAVMGNYLSNLRPNYFAGIRTPWTLESAETWRATHRLGGRLLFFGSVILLLLRFFVSETLFVTLFLTAVAFYAVWAIWYSWHHFHRHGATPLPASHE